jgi:hypothetical protein
MPLRGRTIVKLMIAERHDVGANERQDVGGLLALEEGVPGRADELVASVDAQRSRVGRLCLLAHCGEARVAAVALRRFIGTGRILEAQLLRRQACRRVPALGQGVCVVSGTTRSDQSGQPEQLCGSRDERREAWHQLCADCTMARGAWGGRRSVAALCRPPRHDADGRGAVCPSTLQG